MAGPQKNFTLGEERVAEFESWCDENGYDHKAVFLAGWLEILRMEHKKRKTLFKVVAPLLDTKVQGRLTDLDESQNGELGSIVQNPRKPRRASGDKGV